MLDDVRWTPAGRRVALGSVITTCFYRDGGGVTLDDVVVFTDERTAGDLVL